MKIGIDIRSTLRQRTGIGQYVLNLVNHLANIDSENKYFLYSKKKIIDRKRKLPKLPARNFSHRVDYFSLGANKILRGSDIFYTSSFDLKPPAGAKFVLTVHDVINKSYPQGHTEETLELSDRLLRGTLPLVDKIIVDSECTKKDLMKWYDVKDEIVKVVYPGVNTWFFPQNKKKEGYILYVGTIEPRKNIANLILAFDSLRLKHQIQHKLMIIGMKGWMSEGVFELVKKLNLQKEVIFKGFIPNEKLGLWYSQADVFVFPSFYEGFGFPIVEAFACGLPVVTSNVSSCKEVAGKAALLIDPNNPEDIAGAIKNIISDEELKKSLIEKGLTRAQKFSWDVAAREVLDIFNECGS